MGAALTAARVSSDLAVLARAGLDLDTFFAEVDASLRRAVPYIGACVATVDPTTHLLTGTLKFGVLQGQDEHDHQWGVMEYGQVEPTSFLQLARSGATAAGVHLVTGGDVDESPRIREFMAPHFGFTDELRLLLRCDGQLWGGVALFRDSVSSPFDEEAADFLTAVSATLAAGLRAGLLAQAAGGPPPASGGPAVIIVGPDNAVTQLSVGAEERLAELSAGRHAAAPSGVVGALVAAARRFATGEAPVSPRCRVRSRSGMWLVLHAAPLATAGRVNGDVVVTIEEARPPEIVPLVVAAFELTPRERDVTQLVLQGVDTKDIAAALHLSAYTVQDHLKSVFEKADVRSRRELIARIYFEQYVPRMGAELGPGGWFASA